MRTQPRYGLALSLGLVLSGGACGSEPPTAQGAAEETSGDESLTTMARKVAPGQGVNAAVTGETVQQAPPKSAVPTLVPKLAAVAAPKEQEDSGAQWGAPETESGAALPPRAKPNANAASAYAEGVTALKAYQLDAAKRAFARALSADPKAYQAAYALG
ncbi:MAG: hypothetical protein ABW321_15650, partial [Polyangiales bacterium]